MGNTNPRVVVIAGPNGAGKTTASRRLLQGAMAVQEFVNADAIAQGLSAFRPDAAAFQAGRIMLTRLKQLAAARTDFAFETTLASRHFAPWIGELVRQGYTFHLMFLWLPSPDFAIARVAQRVRAGGHDVPVETVRRRYAAGLRNFFGIYRSLARRWRVYDTSTPAQPRLIASGSYAATRVISQLTLWERVQREHGHEKSP